MGNQAPLNTAFLGMGRPSFDRGALESDGVPLSVIEALMYLQATLAAMGHAGPSEGDDQRWQNVVARFVDPNWEIYGARPDTPLTPDLIPGLAGGGEIAVELDNTVINAATTILNFSTAFTVVDAGGGQVDIDVTGGGGGASYTASTPLLLTGADFSLQFGFGLLESASTLIADIGDGLEADSNKFRVKAHTYIDVTSSGVAVDFTEVASYNGAGDQYLRNNGGTFQWATLPPDTNTTYTAGAGINLSGTKFIADPNTTSHVGLVDPATGDDSSADDAQIGILWHEIANYDVDENMLIGHAASDSSKPVVEYKTVEDWLKTLPGYDTHRVLVSDETGVVKWYTVNETLDMLTGRDDTKDQSIGADVAGTPEWQDDGTECP